MATTGLRRSIGYLQRREANDDEEEVNARGGVEACVIRPGRCPLGPGFVGGRIPFPPLVLSRRGDGRVCDRIPVSSSVTVVNPSASASELSLWTPRELRLARRGRGVRSCLQATLGMDAVVFPERILDGKATAQLVRDEVAVAVKELKEARGRAPGLAVVIVGTRKDSQTYVRSKRKACEDVGISSFLFELPETVEQEELSKLVESLNQNPDVDGILVQLPLPKTIDERQVLEKIALEKDVDGFHPLNVGELCMNGREPLFIPCTPKVGCRFGA